MSTDIFTTRELLDTLDDLERPSSFLLNRFFTKEVTFEGDVIDFDVVAKGRNLAPFVSPLVEGVIQENRGSRTKTFRAAYLKPKNLVDPDKPFVRMAGEKIGGVLSPSERWEAAVSQILLDHDESILRRKEWMAMQALKSGKVTVKGKGYDERVVDFGRDPSLSKVLAGDDRWGEEGVSVLKSLESWAGEIQSFSSAPVTDVVFDPKAWGLAREDKDFLEKLDNRRQASGSVELGPIQRGQGDKKGRYVGSIGDFDFWVYQEIYEDENGDEQQLMEDNSVVLAGTALEGTQAFGAIKDKRAGWQAMSLFPKMWDDEDPAGTFVMTQSAPLIIPARPNNSMHVVVR